MIFFLLARLSVVAQDFSVIDSFFSEKVVVKQLAGAVTFVARDNEVLHYRSYGFMDIEQAVPMNKNAIIPIASMTKLMTSISILILQEEGRLNIDEPVEKYLPQFSHLKVYVQPNTSETENITTKPTIRHLLNHTAGFVYGGASYAEAGFSNWNRPLPEFIDKITAIPLSFQPGTNYRYSYSHDILGYLIEKISGITLDRFMKERLFVPLGMNDTDFYVPKEKSDRQSDLYRYNGSLEKIDLLGRSVYNRLPVALSGGGGWSDSYGGVVSTVSDFYLLTNWLLNYNNLEHIDILNSNSLKMLTSNQIGELFASSSNSYKYGLGVGVMEGSDGETKEIFWAGSPYNTYFWVNYDKKEIGILFTNTAPYRHLDMMNKFKEMVNEI